jgi:hypothetical protein
LISGYARINFDFVVYDSQAIKNQESFTSSLNTSLNSYMPFFPTIQRAASNAPLAKPARERAV